MSWPQQQIGFKQSRKLCLNLWSLRWLKPNLSLVISFIPIGLWQLKVLLGVGRMNCKLLFLKRAKLLEFLMISYGFDYSLDCTGREKRVLKKGMFDTEPSNVFDIVSCSVCFPSHDKVFGVTSRFQIIHFRLVYLVLLQYTSKSSWNLAHYIKLQKVEKSKS